MITALQKSIGILVEDELEMARSEHGTEFNSHHEAYGVTREEIQEAGDELKRIRKRLKDVWGYIKHDLDVGEIELTEIEKRAINGACELIQVAAMARKWKESGIK